MINRCKECGDICPDFSELCDCCAFIKEEDYKFIELVQKEIEDN